VNVYPNPNPNPYSNPLGLLGNEILITSSMQQFCDCRYYCLYFIDAEMVKDGES